jgi:DNA-binding NtrC family response regulator
LLHAALTRFGYAVATTTSPANALERLQTQSFDTVITDPEMAEMDGLDLCQRVLEFRRVPVIVLTVHGDVASAARALRAGAFDFLTKPLDPNLLSVGVARAVQHARIRAELERSRARSPLLPSQIV